MLLRRGTKSQQLGQARVTSIDIACEGERTTGTPAEASITIFVCITCRGGLPLDIVPVPGAVLAEATICAATGTAITVRRVRCLANCNRGLSAAVRRDGAWTYVFGQLDVTTGAGALIEGARLFAHSPDGLMPWRGRPAVLKRGLVARTPPFEFAGDAE
jgi:predicted metal-binding protein